MKGTRPSLTRRSVMSDASSTEASDNCGCCRPPEKTTDDLVSELLARRDALDERLRRLEPVGAAR